ncbi:MAG: hypothetical protein ABWY16_20565 [Pedobacter sp.]|uniref:hypothetical protein n=1 Tax=Pedobacter sp. TaxID=1411316 RepID=UPI003395AC6C
MINETTMLYNELAKSLTELDKLSHMIKKLETTGAPVWELLNGTFLKDEMCRIKARATVDILIFERYAHVYFDYNNSEIRRLIIRVNHLRIYLLGLCFMEEKEKDLYEICLFMTEELSELAVFFYNLHKDYSDRNTYPGED